MYGRIFASAFEGSMVGSGGVTFAVWAYALSRERDGVVELHPVLLAAVIGEPIERIEAAIQRLSAPDPKSRNPAEEGRRIVHLDAYRWRIVSQEIYAAIKTADDLRAYNRRKKAESRARLVNLDVKSSQGQSRKMPSQTETDPETQIQTQTQPERERAREEQAPSQTAAAVPSDDPDPGRETSCPLDLLTRPGTVSLLRELAERLPAPLASLEHEAREFVAYWTIGGGAGDKRAGWPRRLRQQLVKRHGENQLTAPGALEHAKRNGNGRRRHDLDLPEPKREIPADVRAILGKFAP